MTTSQRIYEAVKDE
jgi:hypothetical protein